MIREKTYDREIIIDLTGPQGNAFFLLGYAQKLAFNLGYSTSDTILMIEDMKSSDYEHLIQVFDKHFGAFVILER
jgi:hypothetical protein